MAENLFHFFGARRKKKKKKKVGGGKRERRCLSGRGRDPRPVLVSCFACVRNLHQEQTKKNTERYAERIERYWGQVRGAGGRGERMTRGANLKGDKAIFVCLFVCLFLLVH